MEKYQDYLSKQQLQQFYKLVQYHKMDENLEKLTFRFYCQFKYNSTQISPEKIPMILRCALFLAQKSQETISIKGEVIQGIGFSLNDILKKYSNLQEFVFILKQFLKKVKLSDKKIENSMNQFIKRFAMVLTFYNKFQQTFKKLQFSQKENDHGYFKTLLSICWTLFIDCKNNMFQPDEIISITCLLACVIDFAIIYSSDWVNKNQQFCKKGSIQKLLQMYAIHDLKMFKNVDNFFSDYIQGVVLYYQLIKKDILKKSNDKNDFLSPALIFSNYKKIDLVYQKNLDINQFDQRFLLKQRVISITPTKFTPFIKQGNTNKYKSKAQKKLAILDFNIDSTQNKNPNKQHHNKQKGLKDLPTTIQQTQIKINVLNHQQKFKHITFNTNIMNTPAVTATPLTKGMQMYNWAIEKPKLVKHYKFKKFDQFAQQIIQKIVQYQRRQIQEGNQQKTNKQHRKNIIYGFYKMASQQYFSNSNQQKQQACKCLIALSSQSIFYVLNSSNIEFTQLMEFLHLPIYQLWRVTDFFLKFDKTMPNPLKIYLLDIEIRLISYDLWRSDSYIVQLVKANKKGKVQQPDEREGKLCHKQERFFKRLLHQIAYQVYQLAQSLNIQQQISQNIFSLVKHIITKQPELIINRHIDQIILCSFFAICKASKKQTRFIDIKNKYQELNPNNKNMHHQLMFNVYINNSQRLDIIKFYNTIFRHSAKKVNFNQKKIDLMYINNGNNLAHLKNSPITHNLMHSPLKSLLPKDIVNLKKTNTLKKNLLTPQDHQLYAYSQSPLLKQTNIKPSKKVLNQDSQSNQQEEAERTMEFLNAKFVKVNKNAKK